MYVSLTIHAEPFFDERKLTCVEVFQFSPPIIVDPMRIPIISTFSVFNQVFVNSVALPSSQIVKNDVYHNYPCNSVFDLYNAEFTRNAVTSRAGNYQLLIKGRMTISTLAIAFTSYGAPCLSFGAYTVRRTSADITSFLPVPIFLLTEVLEIRISSSATLAVCTQAPCIINDFFFALGDVACQRTKQLSVWFDCAAKLFYPADYIEILHEMEAKLDCNEHSLNFYIDATSTEVEIYYNFAVIPMVDMENNYDYKYLEYYYVCLNALAGYIFNFPTMCLTDKRAMLILPELAKLIINRYMLTEEENEWNLYNTKLNWGVYCNAAMPQLWSANYEQYRAIADDYIDYTLKMGYMSADVRVSGMKWGSLAFANDPIKTVTYPGYSQDIEKFIKNNIDDCVENAPQQVKQPDYYTLHLLLYDFSYPRTDSRRQLNYLQLRAKIIAYTIFNNSEDSDVLLAHFLGAGRFSLPEFFRIVSEFQCSTIMSTQAIGIGPDSNIHQYHKFYQVQSNSTVIAQQDKELFRTVFALGYTNQTPRYFLFDRTDYQTDKSKFDLGVQNNSTTNMFTSFIFNKLQIYDGVTVSDNKIQKKQFERGVTEKVCNIVVEKQSSYNYNSQQKQAMGIIDPNGCLPFLVTSRYMSMLIDYKPVSTQMYPKESKIQWSDGNIPYQSVIEVVVSFSKFYYEAFMGKLFEFMALHDFHLREVALCGIFRFYSQYNSEDYTYDNKNLQSVIQEYFYKIQSDRQLNDNKINLSADCVFCLSVLFDNKHFKESWTYDPTLLPNDYTVALCAVLLGYTHMPSIDVLFDFVEYDYYQQSNNNVITLCALYAMAWQMQSIKHRMSEYNKKRVLRLFHGIFSDEGNSVIVRKSILELLTFVFCCADKETIMEAFRIFDFKPEEIKCDCLFCCDKDVTSISQLVAFFSHYDNPAFESTVTFCIRMLFTSHCPSYDYSSYFIGYIDPEFLLYLARPGEYYLRKYHDTSNLLAPNPALDWMIKDQYSQFMLTDHAKTLNVIYDCQFCYLGGSCACSRSTMPRDKVQLLAQMLPSESQSTEDRIIYMVLKCPLHDPVNLSYRKPSAYTTNEQLSNDVGQMLPPQLAPLPEMPFDPNALWKPDYQNRLKTYCACGCADGQTCLCAMISTMNRSYSVQRRKEYLQAIACACQTAFITQEQFSGEFEEYLANLERSSQQTISRVLAAIRQAEDEASAIYNEKSIGCRIYEEELNTWVYIEQFKYLDERIQRGDVDWPRVGVKFGCLDVI